MSHDAAIAAACGAGVCARADVGVEEERGAVGQKIGAGGGGGMIEGDLEVSSVTSGQGVPVSLTPVSLDEFPPPPTPPHLP